MKWFNNSRFQGTLVKKALVGLSALHPYSDNDHWLSVGISGQKSLDADPFEHLHAAKEDLEKIVYKKVHEIDSHKSRIVSEQKNGKSFTWRIYSTCSKEYEYTRNWTKNSHRRDKRGMGSAVQTTFSGLFAFTVFLDFEHQYFPVLSELSAALKISMCLYQVWAFGQAHIDQRQQLKRQQNDEDVIEVTINFSQENQEIAQQLAIFIRHHVELVVSEVDLRIRNFVPGKSTPLVRVRAMPAYKKKAEQSTICKDDFITYDWLNKVETIAFIGLPEYLKKNLKQAYHERHKRGFHKGAYYQNEFADDVMNELTVLHPYLDEYENIFKQKIQRKREAEKLKNTKSSHQAEKSRKRVEESEL
uniref:LAGLIDADG homing endonuclease n=1 Tax=Ditylenchus dipsaci TaxID=166011 RepID=A0A915EKA6_9BILA